MQFIFIALSFLLSIPTAAHAQAQNLVRAEARTEADCERLDEALAYNACLAELGPRVGERRPAIASPAPSSRNPVQRRPDGRKSATFDVITGAR
jgi:hypothetical protein